MAITVSGIPLPAGATFPVEMAQVRREDQDVATVLDLLNEQGSAGAIATLFEAEAILGTMHSQRCPVANWVKAKTGKTVHIGSHVWGMPSEDEHGAYMVARSYPLPAHVSRFVSMFDGGQYPQLRKIQPLTEMQKKVSNGGWVSWGPKLEDLGAVAAKIEAAMKSVGGTYAEIAVDTVAFSAALEEIKSGIEYLASESVPGAIPSPETALCDVKPEIQVHEPGKVLVSA